MKKTNSYNVCGNIKWYSHYGKQYTNSFKKHYEQKLSHEMGIIMENSLVYERTVCCKMWFLVKEIRLPV